MWLRNVKTKIKALRTITQFYWKEKARRFSTRTGEQNEMVKENTILKAFGLLL